MTDKQLVLDLDNTLLCSYFSNNDITQLEMQENKHLYKRVKSLSIVDIMDTDVKGNGNVSSFVVILRPHLQEFIDFCVSYFSKIFVWSAGQNRYVRCLETLIFQNRKKTSNIFTFEDCEFSGEQNKTTIKELIKKNFDLQTTFVIDDRRDTFSKNPENGILIPFYCPKFTKEGIANDQDNALLQLIKWFSSDEVKNCKDVRKLNKSNIFT